MSLECKIRVLETKKLIFALVLIVSSLIFVRGQTHYAFDDLHLVNSNPSFQVTAGKDAAPQENMFRLPRDVEPVLYTLKMVPNFFGNSSFSGEVDIELKIKTPTTKVILHCYNLEIISVEIFRKRNKLNTNYTISSNDQIIIITTKQKMFRSNDIRLNIKFKGSLNDEMMGFYRSSYKVGNTTKWLAITQFEPTYARRAFPCFDEPKYRASFSISVARYPYQKATSNMPLNKTSDVDPSIDKRVWDTFQVTPPMPTYLVAFAVSEFNYRTNAAGVVRVWARENAIDDTAYALTQAVASLKRMEEFVGVPYSLPKLDVFAVPDFSSSAMENWGLTTYRERYSLFNAKIGSERNKELVTSVIVHEFSHQWFGDLVTLAWWDFLWLNEGFATYFEYFVTAIVEPSWRMDEIFIVEVLQNALGHDGIFTHSTMNSKVTSLPAIKWKFDVISYDKAGCVIRMIEHILTPSTFKKALQLYLQTRKYAVAEPSHLYEALEEQMRKEGKTLPNKLNVTQVFKKFADQSGYPCISVSRQRRSDRANIIIKQAPYKSPRSSHNVTEKTWIVPLTCTKQFQPDFSNTQPTMWLVDETQIVLNNEVRNDEWYICNLQQSGYFRVNYDEENWQLLIKQLHSSHLKIHQLNRVQLINDACTFARDNYLPYNIMFDLLRYLAHEIDPIPWYRGLIEIQSLISEYSESKVSREVRHFAKHIVGHFYNHVGFYEKPEDNHLVKIVRSQLTFVACDLEIEECVAKAQSEFSSRANLSEIPAYIKETVLCVAIRTNSELSMWNKLWNLYRNSNYSYEKETVLLSMGCAKNQTLLKKYLHKLVDKDDHDIRRQDEIFVFRSIKRFSSGVTATINYIHDMLPKLENCSRTHNMIMRLMYNIMDRVQSQEQIHRLDHVIEEVEKLNQQTYGDIKETLLKIKASAIKTKAKIDKEAEKIFTALTNPIPTTPKPSSASILVPQTVLIMIIFSTVLKL